MLGGGGGSVARDTPGVSGCLVSCVRAILFGWHYSAGGGGVV